MGACDWLRIVERVRELRVLQVHNSYRQPGGEDRVVEGERRLLEEAGHTIEHLTVTNPDSPLASVGRLAIAPWNPSAAAIVRRKTEQFRPDVIHVHNTWFSLSPSVIRAARRAGAPVVVTLHNYRSTCIESGLLRDGRPCEVCVEDSVWNGVRFRCYRDSFLQSVPAAMTTSVSARVRSDVALYLALTEFARDIYVRAGFAPDRVVVKSNFVDDPGTRAKPPSGSDRILFVGRTSHQKGIDHLLRAWAIARPTGLRLTVVGDGDLRSSLEDLHPGVEWLGWRGPAQVRALMVESRALVFPSRSYEGQSLALLEAMAAGLPIIASDWASLRETVGPEGRFGGSGDDEAWAELLTGLTDDESVDRYGAALRRQYESRFTPQRALENLEAVYRRALDLAERTIRPAAE